MGVQWKLTHKGIAYIGKDENGVITFPGPDETIILSLTFARACEIASWPGRDQLKRINATLQKIEVFQGREYRDREFLGLEYCQHCGAVVTVIDTDFKIHAIPSCKGWKA